jgi:tRNA pseudouridine38-40 synthase
MMESDRAGRVALRTVQGVLERVVREVVREPIELVGASRTDSGVHARGQVCAFTTRPDGKGLGWPTTRGADKLMLAINSRLPEDVVVRASEVTHGTFNPIGDAIEKTYSYSMVVGGGRPIRDRNFVWWLPRGSLDVQLMHECAQVLVGEHDFASFATTGHGRQSTVRRVFSCDVRAENVHLHERGAGGHAKANQRVVMTIRGNGFLWNMVRIIAGTLTQVGLQAEDGAWTIDRVRKALESCDRTKAGRTAPPEGLCLEQIVYGPTRPLVGPISGQSNQE